MTDRAEVLKGVQEVINRQLKRSVEEILEGKKIKEDLGADSLDEAEMVMKLEDKFQITIPEAEIAKIVTVGELVDMVIRLTEKK